MYNSVQKIFLIKQNGCIYLYKIDVKNMKVAVCFLCREISKELTHLMFQSDNSKFDVCVVNDSGQTAIINKQTTCHELILSSDVCKKNGYKNSSYSEGLTHIQNSVVALDRALYLFCEMYDYDFVWFVEDDCFIPSVEALENLVEYSEFDLVTSSHKKKIGTSHEWHWKKAFETFNPPLFSSMSCCFGLSRKMLELTRQHVQKHKELFFLEIMFNTIAAQNNLRIYTPPELATICSQADWSLDDVLTLPNNIFHPYKDFKNAEKLRKLIRLAKAIDYSPADKLPNFLTLKIQE